MAASETVIANLALSHLGNKDSIADLETDPSREAEVCRIFYETARDELLRQYQWPFATKIADLTEVEADPNDEWTRSYRYPSDCLFFRKIQSGLRTDSKDTEVKFRIASDDDGRLIYCDQDDAIGEYTFRAEDTTDYPPDFTMALSYRLASYIAPQLSQGDPFALRDFCLEMYAKSVNAALGAAFLEERLDNPPDSEFITGR